MGDQAPKAAGDARLKGADDILKSWNRLNGIYKSKRYIIENRWLKMKKERRKTFLGDCWVGNMPDNHRPDLDGPAVWRLKGADALALPWPFPRIPNLLSVLLPDYNKTDLGENPVALLSLLENRALKHPGDFSRQDIRPHPNEGLRKYINVDLETPEYWTEEMKKSFAYTGSPFKDDDPEEYGSIVQVDDQTHLDTLLVAGYMSPEEAARTMKVQERIYNFLERFCNDITVSDKMKGWPLKGETKQTIWRRTSNFDENKPEQSEDFRLYLEDEESMAHYCSPFEENSEYLYTLSGYHYMDSIVKLKKFREDPSFFWESMWDIRQHSPTQVIDLETNSRHPWRDVEDNPGPWAHAFKVALRNLVVTCQLWQSIFSRIEDQRKMVKELNTTPRELLRTSTEYQAHTVALMYCVGVYEDEVSQLAVFVKCSPRYRDLYRVRTKEEEDEETGEITKTPIVDISPSANKPRTEQERFITSLLRANDTRKARNVFGPWTILDELSSRLLKEKTESRLIPDMIEKLNAASAINTHVMKSWTAETTTYTDEESPEIMIPSLLPSGIIMILPEQPGSALEGMFREMMTSTTQDGSENIVSLRNKLSHTTKPKARKTERAQAIEAEDNLKRFWAKAEELLENEGCLPLDLLQYLKDVTPVNAYPNDREKQSTPTPAASRPNAKPPAQAFVPLPAATPEDYSAKKLAQGFLKAHQEAKRKEPAEPEPQEAEGAPEEEEQEQWPKIRLRPAEYATVDLLLGPAKEALPGAVPWNDISRLMNEIGFRGPQRHPGSARFFEPSEELRRDQGITQAIGLHEPHGPNMPINMARSWARNRSYGLGKYGWDINSFVEEAG